MKFAIVILKDPEPKSLSRDLGKTTDPLSVETIGLLQCVSTEHPDFTPGCRAAAWQEWSKALLAKNIKLCLTAARLMKREQRTALSQAGTSHLVRRAKKWDFCHPGLNVMLNTVNEINHLLYGCFVSTVRLHKE